MEKNWISVNIQGRNVQALVDSGADYSVISEAFRRSIKAPVFKENGPLLRAADKKPIVTLGKCSLEVQIKGLDIIFYFVVAAECSHDVILGWDFFRATDAIIDCGKNKLYLSEAEKSYEWKDLKLCVAMDCFLPPKSFGKIVVTNQDVFGSRDVVVTGSKRLQLEKRLFIPSSLVRFLHGRAVLWVTNSTHQSQVIPSDMKIGTMQDLEVGSISNLDACSEIAGKDEVTSPDVRECLISMISTDLEETKKNRLLTCLNEFSDIFDFEKKSFPVSGEIKQNRYEQRPYRVSPAERRVIQSEVKKMMETKIIRPSSSPWASPVILVRKKDGSLRFCVDYRRLNKITKKDVHPLPRIDDALDTLSGSRYFSTMDMRSGYWQIEVDDKDREKTAFITPDGLYEFNVMPFGLCNAPATFERMIDNVLRGLKWDMCLCYLDDIVVYGSIFKEHLTRLYKVLRCIQQAGLCLNYKKCHFASRQITILGHVVNEFGTQPDPEKVKAIVHFPKPRNISETRSFLGLSSYYRRFIKSYANKSRPLNSLLKKDEKFIWGEEQDESFRILKQELGSSPVLGHFIEGAETHVHTDASGYGLGAVLVQIQNDAERPIAYASRTLTKAEKNYSTTEKECLAVVWALGKFRPYLYGRPFTVVTDHHSLCWLKPPGLLVPIPPTTSPFQKIGIDYLGRFPISHTGNRWIIVATDYLTRFAITKAAATAEATELATFLIEDVILKHGAPREIITDRGRNLMSQTIREINNLNGTIHRFTTAYHPQTNGLTERLNKTLTDMISMYVDVDQKNWDNILPYVTFAYNTARQETTGYSPFFLVHGREVETPLDSILPYQPAGTAEDYVGHLVTNAEDARMLARLNILQAQSKDKERYDKKHQEVTYKEGDLVWVFTPVRTVGLSEKLLKRYFGPYRVIRKISSVNYQVEGVTNTRRSRKTQDIVHVVRMKPYHDPEGVLLDFLNKGQTITGNYYANLVKQLREAIKEKRRGKLSRKIVYHQDNAPSYRSLQAMAAIHDSGFELLPHAPYSLDIALSDEEVNDAVTSFFESLETSFFLEGIKALRHRWKKCIDLKGDYPGDLVWIFIPVRKVRYSEKLMRRFFGPYKVTRKISVVTYEVKTFGNQQGRLKTKDLVHIYRMKPYLNPEDQEEHLEEDLEDDSPNFQGEDIPTERTQQPKTREEISSPITRSRALRLRISARFRVVWRALPIKLQNELIWRDLAILLAKVVLGKREDKHWTIVAYGHYPAILPAQYVMYEGQHNCDLTPCCKSATNDSQRGSAIKENVIPESNFRLSGRVARENQVGIPLDVSRHVFAGHWCTFISGIHY
ncbi:K02A2.6-like [Cordylochernes scorpioides]|uniref:K02A2.6-like n=1 Tax=Cordylochernes scorpioides TaxID=51811 RepID=A0ABY6LK92_9ARAC|nr:K02A2.6-like [Cordylochernes scorpioides]